MNIPDCKDSSKNLSDVQLIVKANPCNIKDQSYHNIIVNPRARRLINGTLTSHITGTRCNFVKTDLKKGPEKVERATQGIHTKDVIQFDQLILKSGNSGGKVEVSTTISFMDIRYDKINRNDTCRYMIRLV
jgi:hypothetical protein